MPTTSRGSSDRAPSSSPRLPAGGRGRAPGCCDVEQRRRDGRPLDRRVPPARRSRADRLPPRPRRAARGGRAAAVPSTATRSTTLPSPTRSASGCPRHLDADRPDDRKVSSMPLAVTRRRRRWDHLVRARTSSSATSPAPTPRPALPRLAGRPRARRGGGGQRGVRVRDMTDGSEHDVRGTRRRRRRDALRSPQLLWASGVRPRAWVGGSTTSRRRCTPSGCATSTPRRTPPRTPRQEPRITAQSGVNWVPFTDERPLPRPGHAARRLAGPARG